MLLHRDLRHKEKPKITKFFALVMYKYTPPHQFLPLSIQKKSTLVSLFLLQTIGSHPFSFISHIGTQSMISTKILIRMARKWQKMAAIGRKRITSSRTKQKVSSSNCSNKSSVVDKGYFVIYSTDKKRFVVPLAYLRNKILLELLKMSEEEFGLPSDGPITLPCDSVVMDYIVSLLQRGLAEDLEKAVVKGLAEDLEKAAVNSIATYRCSSNIACFHQGLAAQQSLVC